MSAQNPPVPAAYQSIYSNLTSQINTFESTVQAGWNHSSYPTLSTPQLQSASSDQYTQLLNANYMTSAVLPQLQELRALGATGVTIHVDLPILYQPFYASNPAQYEQFVAFYQQLAQTVRNDGLKLVVESAVGEPLPGNNASAFQSYYSTLSWTQYMAARAQNVVNVAQLIEPDYMSVIYEPDTEASVSGQTNVNTPSGSLQLLQTILAALKTANITNVQIGAGAGTWTANYTQYLQNFASTSVNFVDMHIYPINGNDFLEAITAANLIHAAGKPVAMTETWPWKVADSELGNVSYVTMAARDPFSFWAPVDAAFLQAIRDFSQYQQLIFVSPFWTSYFSAYLNYNTYGSYPSSTLLPDAISAASAAVGVGAFTSTALAYEDSIIPAPDTTPPTIPAAPTSAAVGTTGVNVTWIPTPDNVGTAAFQVYQNGVLVDTTTGYIYYAHNLTSGARYSYTIAAFDASGNVSGQSAPLVVTTLNTTPPPPPTNLMVTGTTKSSVSLSWTPSSDISGIAGYRVLRGTSPSNLTIMGTVTGTGTTYTITCQPNTTYYFAVEAYIPNGILSGPSNQVSALTP
jgi:hypothetical protein